MKKIILFAAACVALAACNVKELDVNNPEEGVAFEKGQRVTLTVNACGDTKANGTLDADGNVNFKWEAGDVIKVTVGGTSAEFTVSKLIDGGASAEFTGTMPGSGTTFDAQFPYTEPTLTTQEYVANGVPHNMVLATATGCTVGTPFTLQPQYAALRLNLYGTDASITNIVVTNTSSTATPKPTYTLDCGSGVAINVEESAATPFIIVVDAGTYNINVTASCTSKTPKAYLEYGNGIMISSIQATTTSAKNFQAAKVLNMPAKEVLYTIWAPVNCGYDADHPYGLLFQWGSKKGIQSYHSTSTSEVDASVASTFQGANGTQADNTFYKHDKTGQTFNYDWIMNGSNLFWDKSGNATSTENVTPIKGDFDPCPVGWRVPTYYELNSLTSNRSSETTLSGIAGSYCSGSNPYSTSVNSVFLPYGGYRGVSDDPTLLDRGINGDGCYWTSTIWPSPNYQTCGVIISNSNRKVDGFSRTYTFSVRCVYCGE